jgi:O-antigen ligase
MTWLLIGYMWLFVHRPFEVWPWLGTLRIERVYILICLASRLFLPSPGYVANRLNLAFFTMIVVYTLSALLSPYRDAVTEFPDEFQKAAVFYGLILLSVRGERDLRRLVLGYLTVVFVYMAHSFREYCSGRHVYRMGIPRMVGVDATFSDPNAFASTVVHSLPLALAAWVLCRDRRQCALVLVYVALSVLCVLLTGSRAGLVGLIVLIGCFLPTMLRRKRVLALGLVVSIPLLWAILPDYLKGRFETLVDSSAGPRNAQDSAEGRTRGLLDGIRLWEANPVLGVGPGMFGRAAGTGFQAHNLYGQTLGELGTLGAIALVMIVGGFVLNAREFNRRVDRYDKCSSRFLRAVSRAVMITLLLLLVTGYAGHNLYRYTWMWFGAFQAIALDIMRTGRLKDLISDCEAVNRDEPEAASTDLYASTAASADLA